MGKVINASTGVCKTHSFLEISNFRYIICNDFKEIKVYNLNVLPAIWLKKSVALKIGTAMIPG
jgi:hypothetical protein